VKYFFKEDVMFVENVQRFRNAAWNCDVTGHISDAKVQKVSTLLSGYTGTKSNSFVLEIVNKK
jgi:hypothetical protein